MKTLILANNSPCPGRLRVNDQPAILIGSFAPTRIKSAFLLHVSCEKVIFIIIISTFSYLYSQWIAPTFLWGLHQVLEDSVTCCYEAKKQYGGSLSVFKPGKKLQFEMGIKYRHIDLSNIAANNPQIPRAQNYLHLHMGLRYYPYYPTIQIGEIAIRLTGGVGMGSGVKVARDDFFLDLALLVKAGLKISLTENPNGILIEWLFLPLEEPILDPRTKDINGKVVIRPTHLLGVGFLLAND